MKLACLMMQKNEGSLLESWLAYYSKTFNTSDLFVYDNGSTDEHTLEVLEKYESLGVNVFREFNTKNDFERKGEIIAEKIKDLESKGLYDFFFPLDCDEFMACENEIGALSFDQTSITESLKPFLNRDEVLYIKKEYNNHPSRRDYYLARDVQRKSFFAGDSCENLDMGYHNGTAKRSNVQLKTNIVYIHFHNKPYNLYQQSAREKLSGRVADFSAATLERHLEERRSGFHLIPYLLMSEPDYGNSFKTGKYAYIPQLRKTASGGDTNSFFYAIPSDKCAGYVDSIVRKDDAIQVLGWGVDSGRDSWASIDVECSGERVEVISCERIDRQDVVESRAAKNNDCGFKLRLSTAYDPIEIVILVNEFTPLNRLQTT